MKKFFIIMMVFLLAITSVSAQLSLNDVTLGDESQEREENATATLTVTNTGGSALSNVAVTSNAGAQYNVQFNPSSIASLGAGASQSVEVTGFIPEDQDAGVATLGTITATSGNATATSTLSIEAENNLIIKDVEVIVNGEDDNLDDGDDIKVYPAAEVEFIIEIKNTHSDIDIEDVEVTVEGEDDVDDVDEDDDLGDIKDGKKEEFSFTVTLDDDAEDGNYDVVITVEGEDENGALHGEEWTIEFELEEEGVLITSYDLIPNTLSCGDDEVDLRLELTNVGKNDEDEVSVEIESPSLDFEQRINNLEIEEDDELTRTVTIPVDEDLSPGQHLIEIRSFIDFDEKTHEKTIFLSVPSGCDASDAADDDHDHMEDDSTVVVTTTDSTSMEEETLEDEFEFVDSSVGTSSSFTSGNVWGTVLLVLANILVIVVIVILVMKFLVRN